MQISELMSKPVVTCNVGDNLSVPAGQMWEHDVGIVPVVDAQRALVGVITDRDICMATYTQGKPPGAIAVEQVMSSKVYSCRTTDSVAHAEKVMQTHRIRRLPVVDMERTPIGMLSLNDLARHCAPVRSGKRDNVEGEELLRTIAAVGARRRESRDFSVS